MSSTAGYPIDYVRFQTYFLKQMLVFADSEDDQKIQAFDDAVARIDGAIKKYPINRDRAFALSTPEETSAFYEALIGALAASPYSRLVDEQLYEQDVFRLESRPEILKKVPADHVPRQPTPFTEHLVLPGRGQQVLGKFQKFDFEVPLQMCFPKTVTSMAEDELLKSKAALERSAKEYKAWLQEDTKIRAAKELRNALGKAEQDAIKKRYQESIAKNLQDYIEREKRKLPFTPEQVLKSGVFNGLKVHFFSDLLGARLSSPDNVAREELLKLPREEKLKIINGINDKFSKYRQKLSQISEELIRSGEVAFNNPADQRFFELLLSSYYKDIPENVKKDVIKAIIENPSQDSGMDIFKLLVLHSGPQMQKLLQILGRNEGFSPKLREIFSQVEDAGLETPWETAQEKLRLPPTGFEWISVDQKPMVGSMAQTYKGLARDQTGKTVKIAGRILKDKIREKLDQENSKLETMAGLIDGDPLLRTAEFPLIRPLLGDVKAMAHDETDFSLTTEHQLAGKVKYDSTVYTKGGVQIDFVTPDTLDSPDPDVLYSTWLEGDKFDNFQKANPDLARVVAEAIARKWIQTAFFVGKFFHADLHQGNMKVRQLSEHHIQVGFLDFGMADTLSEQDRSILAKFGIELTGQRSAKLISQYIWSLSDVEQNLFSKAELTRRIAQRMKTNKSTEISKWLKWSMSEGIKLKKNISSFSRGLSAVEQLLSAGKSDVSVGTLTVEVAKGYKWDITKFGMQLLKDKVMPLPRDPKPVTCKALFAK